MSQEKLLPLAKHQFFLVFWVSTADFGFSAGRRKVSDFFPEVPVTKIRVSAPAPDKNPTVIFISRDTFSDSIAKLFRACFPEKTKAYTTTTEGKSFGELFWPQRKTFQVGGGYKNPMETRKTISTTEIFPLWPPFFRQRKVLHWSRVVNAFFFPVFLGYRTSIARCVAKWGIALICLCKKRHQRGVSHPVGGLLGWLRKYRAIGGIAAIVSQYRAIWGH